MIDEVIRESKFIPPYVTRAQTGLVEFPYRGTYYIFGYASDSMLDAHSDIYGAGSPNGYVYTFSINPNAKHFSPYMFFKDIHKGLREYDDQDWWEDEWVSKRDLGSYLWDNLNVQIDEDDKSFAGTRGVPEMEIKSLGDLSEDGLKILELYADYANLPIEVAAENLEFFLELRHSGSGYDPSVNESAFYNALLDLGYAGLYEWEYEEPDFPLNFVVLDPSAIDSYRMIRTKDVPPGVDTNDYLQQQPWIQADFPSPPRRSNPALKVDSGYLVNPETGDTYWFHGSWTGRKRKFDWKSPRRHAYGATYFTSSEELAADFATGERAWLNFDEEPPPMKRTGYMHRVQIKDVPLVDSDNLFVDKEALALSEEGVAFVQALQQFGASDADIESFIRTLSGGTYHAFSKQNNSIWPALIRTIEHLGYRGWFERESVHRSHTNIGLLEPDEDARIRGGYTVKRTRRFNPADDGILIKFSFRALQTYFEFANDFTYVADAKVLFAAFAQHIDLYRVLDQREMYLISTEGDFGGGHFNTEIERVTGAAFAATSIQDVVKWGKGWRKSGRLMGDLYVLEVDGFGRVFSHLNNPERMGIDMSGLRGALAEYRKGYISIEEGIEMSGLLDREYSIPRSEICTTGLGCSISLKEWDTFKVYKVVGDRVEEIDGIPYDVEFPVLRTMYAIANSDAETLNDLMYDGVWGRGVYVTNNLDTAVQDAERLGLGVFEVGVTIPEERGTVFEISKKNTELSKRGSSLKRGTDGSLNAFVVDVRPANESGYAKRLFVSQTPLDHTILYDDFEREALVDQTLEENDIYCGAQGYTSIGLWLRAIEYIEIVDCEGYEDLVFDIGEEKADEQLIDSYNYLLRELAGLSSYDPHNVLRLSDTSKLGHVIKKRGYLAVRSRLNSPFDNYLCILDPLNLRSRVIADLEGDMS